MQRDTARPAIVRYAVAVLSVAVAVVLAWWLRPVALAAAQLLLVAILVIGWVSGLRPALVAWGLALLAFDYYFTPPYDSLKVEAADIPRLLIFMLVAFFMATMSAARRRAEDSLTSARAELEARVRARTVELQQQADLLDLTHDTIFVRDMNDVITYWNRAAEDFYGWPAAHAVGRVSHELMQTVFPAPIEQIQAELLRQGRWEGELVHTKADGSQGVVASRWSLQHDDAGRPHAILEINNDVTNRKQAEAQLRESEQRYRDIFDSTGVSIWEADFSQAKAAIDGLGLGDGREIRDHLAAHPELVRHLMRLVRVVDVNRTSLTLFGATSKEELLGALPRVFVPETRDALVNVLVGVAEGRASVEAEAVVQTIAGDRLTVLFTLAVPSPPARLDRVLLTVMDITERKRAEYLAGHVFETAPDAIYIVGLDYRYQRVNPAFARRWGLPAERIVGMTVDELAGSEPFEETYKSNFDRCFRGEEVSFMGWFPTPAGRQYLAATYSPLRPDARRVEAALAITRDLTQYARPRRRSSRPRRSSRT